MKVCWLELLDDDLLTRVSCAPTDRSCQRECVYKQTERAVDDREILERIANRNGCLLKLDVCWKRKIAGGRVYLKGNNGLADSREPHARLNRRESTQEEARSRDTNLVVRLLAVRCLITDSC